MSDGRNAMTIDQRKKNDITLQICIAYNIGVEFDLENFIEYVQKETGILTIDSLDHLIATLGKNMEVINTPYQSLYKWHLRDNTYVFVMDFKDYRLMSIYYVPPVIEEPTPTPEIPVGIDGIPLSKDYQLDN